MIATPLKGVITDTARVTERQMFISPSGHSEVSLGICQYELYHSYNLGFLVNSNFKEY